MSGWNARNYEEPAPTPDPGEHRPAPPSLRRRPLTCPECQKQFSRPSHLNRHRLTHLPEDEKYHIPCPQCDHRFARRDVMIRHLRASHNGNPVLHRSLPQACLRCVAKKLRCGGTTRPCRNCALSRSLCEYPPSVDVPGYDYEQPTILDSIDVATSPPGQWGEEEEGEDEEDARDLSGDTTMVSLSQASPKALHQARHQAFPQDVHHAPPRIEHTPVSTAEAALASMGMATQRLRARPQALHQARPQASPKSVPQVRHQGAPQTRHQPQPQARHQARTQAQFQVLPQASPQAPPQALPQVLPQARSHAAQPQILPQVLPQALPTPDSTAEAALASMVMANPGFGFQDPSVNVFPTGEDSMNLCTDDDSLSPSYFALMQPELRSHGFDWLGFDMPGLYSDPQQQQWARSNEAVMPPGPIDLDHQTVAEPATSAARPQQAPEAGQGAQPWPFDQSKDAAPHRYKLPPLKDVLQSAHPSSLTPGGMRLDDFVQLLSEPKLPALGSIQRSGVRQAFGEFQRLLDLYFDRFHDIQAIIHKPTWNMAACPTVLLTAMACIGALLSGDERDTELSSALSDICMPMINWLGAADGNNYSDISYLNALCIHQIYSLGSGNRQLYQNADRSRGILIGSLRGVGLLSSQWRAGDEESSEPDHRRLDPSAITREYNAWVKAEEARRAAWAAFEYDCSLCTLTSRRGAVDLGELPRKLPCIESLWNAASPQAWVALRSRLTPASFSPNLFVVLKTLLAGQRINLALGSWAKRLCAQVLGRLLWDIKELEAVAMPNRLGLHSLMNPYKESKRSILTALDSLLKLTATPTSTADLITYNITGLLCHYSHLYAADDVMDVVLFIVRNLMSQDPNQIKSLEIARKRLQSIFARDPRGSRSLAWHSAQMISIANEYLVSAPCEIMRVFMGYVFIMAYSTYGPRHDGRKQPVRLDVYMSAQQKADVDEWIHTGGPATVGSVRDISSAGRLPTISHDAQTIMNKLQCWGLANKFTKILSRIAADGM